MTLEVVPYDPAHASQWDDFCARAVNSTFLHTRRFLSYHGDRFEDASVLLLSDGRLAGVFPAARTAGSVASHPGLTYGGIVHDGALGGASMLEAMDALGRHYAASGCIELVYKPVPYIYASRPAHDDLYALHRAGAKRVAAGLSCAIDLGAEPARNQQRKRGLAKAEKAVTIRNETRLAGALWEVLAENLTRRHGVSPVHSREELELLITLFPDHIAVYCAEMDGAVEAGTVVFKSPRTWHAQYIAASERAYAASALDAVFDAAIREARNTGVRYFDFGVSTENGGAVLNEGLHRFKSGFGGGGVVYEAYSLALAP